MTRLAFLVVLAAACTERNPLYCQSDTDCTDPERPFCDVNDEYQGSGGLKNQCIATPSDCPIDRCGCTPGAGISCDNDQLTSCAADGRSLATTTCGLGCSTTPRCLTFTPTNGLAAALASAATAPDVVLADGSEINTDAGTVSDPDGHPLTVATTTVDQGGSTIRVYYAHSFTVGRLSVGGATALALVAADSLDVTGTLSLHAIGSVGGPGAQEAPATCVGGNSQLQGSPVTASNGPGGGGNADPGGDGGGWGGPGAAGGTIVPDFAPLRGGCRGGSLYDESATILDLGGGGGGALQLVAGNRIEFSAAGMLDLGGGGGAAYTGGGSGGTAVLEAPSVVFASATGFSAYGGAAGSCGSSGQDASLTGGAAAAPSCTDFSGGYGGTSTAPPQNGRQTACSPTCTTSGSKGGGGGSAGRVRIATKDGTFTKTDTSPQRAVVTTDTLTPQ